MRNSVLAIFCCVISAAVFAQNKLTPAERIAKAGGEVIKPGSFAGKVSIVNQQNHLPESDCEAIAALLATETECNFVVDSGENATIKLYLIDDAKEPIMLLAPEDHWGKLNLARMVEDLPGENAKQKFFVPRARKMIIKALSLLIGGGSSQFPGNIMNAATMRQLDHCGESIPVDMVENYTIYLKAIGVTPMKKTTYRRAVREGWAPAPTNAVQQAIWDKIKAEQNAAPTSPIRILPGQKPKDK